MDADDPAFVDLQRDPDVAATIAFFAGLGEPDRRALAPAVRRWMDHEEARDRPARLHVEVDEIPEDPEARRAWHEERSRIDRLERESRDRGREAARAGLLATATLAELTKRGSRITVNRRTVGALVDRRPLWYADLVDHLLRGEWKRIDWDSVCVLVEAGAMPIPTSPDLPDLLVEEMPWYQRRSISIVEHLRREWAVNESVLWRIFNTPTSALGSDDWRDALVELSASGEVDRDRLLNAVLAGLGRDDMRPKQLRWFLALVAALDPSRDELAARQDALADLLRAELPAVPAAAMRWLTIIGVADLEHPELVLHGLEVAVLAKTKATGGAAVKLAGALFDREPAPADAVLGVATLGMGHADRKVAERALELAAKALAATPSEGRAAWSARLADVLSGWPITEAAAARAQLDLTPDAGGTPGPHDSSDPIDPAADEHLRAQAAALAPEVRTRWGLDAALAALDGGPEPPAVIPGSPSLDPLALGDPVAPITDLDELADACGRALGQPDDSLATELAIDGLARLGLDLDPSATRYRALVRQAGQVLQRSSPAPSRMLARAICLMADTSLHSEALVRGIAGVDDVVAGRTQEIGARLHRNMAGPTLATPSHTRGWISADVLAERIAAWPDGLDPGTADPLCALLRLHSAAIEKPRARLAELAATSPLAARFAYALGAEVSWPDGSEHLLMVAEDTRQRLAEPNWPDHMATEAFEERRRRQEAWEAMEQLPIQERIAAQRARVSIPRQEWEEQKRLAREGHLVPRFTTVPALLLNEESWTPAHLRWNLTAAPAYPDVVALGTSGVAAPHLEPLLHPEQPVGSIFPLIMAVATSESDPVLQALTADVLVQLIDDGRFEPVRHGEVAARYLATGHIKTNRLTSLLGRVAGAGDLHADEVARMLDHLVAGLDDAPTDAFALLELSDELHGRCGRAVADSDARVSLERWSRGNSRRAKMARQLLGRQASPSPVRAAAALTRVQLRFDRAQAAGRGEQ